MIASTFPVATDLASASLSGSALHVRQYAAAVVMASIFDHAITRGTIARLKMGQVSRSWRNSCTSSPGLRNEPTLTPVIGPKVYGASCCARRSCSSSASQRARHLPGVEPDADLDPRLTYRALPLVGQD